MTSVQAAFLMALPRPQSGCAECSRLARARDAARERFDHSRVSDCNALMRRHQKEEHESNAEAAEEA